MYTFFENDDFQFGTEIALGSAYRQSADIGEVLAVVARIPEGDADAWTEQWLAAAEKFAGSAAAAEREGHLVSALAAYRRACTYWATALYMIDHSRLADRQTEIWHDQRQAWERVVDLTRPAGERLSIPYENTELAGYLFPAPGASRNERRPLVIMNNGSDGATSQMWVQGGAAAAERGWHWMTFDGPGQQSSLIEKGIPFRPDWEAVLGPVLETALAREDVDPDRIAVVGVSQAGFWVPRALSFEHRFAAAVADPGVTDVSASWLAHLPPPMREMLSEGRQEEFDTWMGATTEEAPDQAATFRFRARPFGIESGSSFEVFREVLRYRLGDEVAQIRTPILVTDPENEQFWPGQARDLYDRLPGEKQLVAFTAQEGADRHCEPTGSALREARVFDWLEQRLA